MKAIVLAVLVSCVLETFSQTSESTILTGRVIDQNGAGIPNALVRFDGRSAVQRETHSGADGSFALDAAGRQTGTLHVSAKGFLNTELRWTSDNNASSITVTLFPAALSEQVVITPTRTETDIDETPASIVVLSSSDLAKSPNVSLDDSLRQIPGFQLFRRTSSSVANPTAQGVSLRGLGANGASRTLVLADGIPLNDPFGGWIYWGRVPRESIERVEVLRGSASSLYGSGALGGTVNIMTHDTSGQALSFGAFAGSRTTAGASVFAGVRKKDWGIAFAAEGFRTGGYIPVENASRGPVDVEADSSRSSFDLRISRQFREEAELIGRAGYFVEGRGNGTAAQTNRTHIRSLSLGSSFSSNDLGYFSARIYGGDQVYDQIFTAVAPDRTSENLLRIQRVPAHVFGLSSEWTHAFGAANMVVAGIDTRQVRGFSDETVMVQGNAASLVSSGGQERAFGVFGSDIFQAGKKVTLVTRVRYDRWNNLDARMTSTSLVDPGQSATIEFPDRNESAVSPQFSVLYRQSETLSVFASIYRSFRAPTLNELYRSFRVGNVFTLANENLRAERLTGGEGGLFYLSRSGELDVRGTAFWSEVDRSIANVTISTTPSLITRQRQNLGKTRSRGLEADLEWRPADAVRISTRYLFVDSTVVEFPGTDALVSLTIPQIARHQYSFQVAYDTSSSFSLVIQGRGSSRQFDDDQNLFPLGRYFTLDVRVSRRLQKNLEVYAAFENLLNQRYDVGRTPVVSLGPPISASVGMRIRIRKK